MSDVVALMNNGDKYVISGGTNTVDFLLVGGGGSGGYTLCFSNAGGGGGAGGVIQGCNYELPSGQSYCVTVGAGATKGCLMGGSSCFRNFQAYGGGSGGCTYVGYPNGVGNVGGSGGGGGGNYAGGKGYQGCDGWCGYSGEFAGGGGGYTSSGTCCTSKCGVYWTGGNGIQSDISGSNQYYAYGGAAGGCYCCSYCAASPGGGGKGGGCCTNCCNGCDATTCGSGGGGAGRGNNLIPGNGGNGVFILRYPTACGYKMTGGCKYTCGNYTIHCFTSSGNLYVGDLPDLYCCSGIYHNQSLGLITMSCGNGYWLTLADKNLGATSTDVSSTDSYGCFYQWGNNYGFPQSGFTCTNTCTDASGFGPGNYYCCCNFIYTSNNCDWSTVTNDNLWGDTTNTNTARKGPSPDGYHVPSFSDKCRMVIIMQGVLGRSVVTSDTANYLYMPCSGYMSYNSGIVYCVGVDGRWRLGSYYAAGAYPNGLSYSTGTPNCSSSSNYNRRATGYPVRPFKDEPVIPDESWCKLV